MPAHAARLNSYSLLKAEIDAYLERKLAVASGGAAPMDLDALKGKPNKGKGLGKTKASNDSGKGSSHKPCKHCNRPLTSAHTEWDCWYNPRNNSLESKAK